MKLKLLVCCCVKVIAACVLLGEVIAACVLLGEVIATCVLLNPVRGCSHRILLKQNVEKHCYTMSTVLVYISCHYVCFRRAEMLHLVVG